MLSAADGDAPVEGDDHLDRMVGMSRDDAPGAGDQEEPAFPQVPPWSAQPAIRFLPRLFVGSASSSRERTTLRSHTRILVDGTSDRRTVHLAALRSGLVATLFVG